MSSSHGSGHTDAERMEQIVIEFFPKSLHIILESRSSFVSSRNYSGEQSSSSPASSSTSSPSVRPRDKWFHLAIRDCPVALENFDFWRQSNGEPLVVDVVLLHRTYRVDPFGNIEHEGCDAEARGEKIIERWIIQYERRKSKENDSGRRRSITVSTLYKKAMILLRSLFATVRLLPAYKLFRELNSSGQLHEFTIVPRVLSFVEPFTRKDESQMKRFEFTPVDTSCGRLCLSVLYFSSFADISSKLSTPMSPQFIPDYVGSPIADPIKRLPSFPPHGSPSSPFGRPHSWSHGIHKASQSPKLCFLSSPTDLKTPASVPSNSRRIPPVNYPSQSPRSSAVENKDLTFDEYLPSPAFSPSHSPSPPMYVTECNPSKTLFRCESAPVHIPEAKLVHLPTVSNKKVFSPSPSFKGSRFSSSKGDKCMGLVHTGATVEKLCSLGKDDSGKFSGLRTSSNSSPRISVSRSSSRLSFRDDIDDSEFACPFIADDDDIAEASSRPETMDQRGSLCNQMETCGLYPVKKSQHAAVGALVRMLKKAPPLCQDVSVSTNSSQPCKLPASSLTVTQEPAVWHAAASSVLSSVSKTTADALEELRGYREMKDLLLNRSSQSQTLPSSTATQMGGVP